MVRVEVGWHDEATANDWKGLDDPVSAALRRCTGVGWLCLGERAVLYRNGCWMECPVPAEATECLRDYQEKNPFQETRFDFDPAQSRPANDRR